MKFANAELGCSKTIVNAKEASVYAFSLND